ncbi:type II secretion system F family protein [Gordonia sp. (in: high G+C Gram-positive bacteria)]|uniref:type II secretion system F family protein n=1 Tax=Gordonia sp. (in: high G+C Gram-positive bacteria) TaxID=84139 RepID=UPI0039E40422
MTALALVLIAAAVIIGPAPPGLFRFRRIFGSAPEDRGMRGRRRWLAPAVAAAAAAVVAGSPAVMAATIVVGGVTAWLMRRSTRDREAAERDEATLRAISVVVAELTVGAPTAAACATAGSEVLLDDPSSTVGRDLATLAAQVRLGGDIAPASGPIADLWAASARFGLPLADLLAARRADLVARQRFTARTKAALAGPRATARVLAVLPLFGLLLGQAIGANPVRVLLAPGPGGTLLVIGTVLAAVGVVWSEHIVDGVQS